MSFKPINNSNWKNILYKTKTQFDVMFEYFTAYPRFIESKFMSVMNINSNIHRYKYLIFENKTNFLLENKQQLIDFAAHHYFIIPTHFYFFKNTSYAQFSYVLLP